MLLVFARIYSKQKNPYCKQANHEQVTVKNHEQASVNDEASNIIKLLQASMQAKFTTASKQNLLATEKENTP